jgi:hypothetical protein
LNAQEGNAGFANAIGLVKKLILALCDVARDLRKRFNEDNNVRKI